MKRLVLIAMILFFVAPAYAAEVKEADLAGSWYPASRVELSALLNGYLKKAEPGSVDGQVFAIISPHAGYQFSGPVAAYGYKLVEGRPVSTAIVIGFSHRKLFDGIAVYGRGSWITPLGEVRIDEQLAARIIARNPRIRFEPEIFNEENSVEMQIPFVQESLKSAKVVPIAFGTQDYKDAEILADALSEVSKDRNDVLLIASTDLSHYHPYEDANSIDKHTINVLGGMDARKLYDEARIGTSELCGIMPVTTVLLAAKKIGFDSVKILKYANSGDTFGDKNRVVGYLAAAVYASNQKPARPGSSKQQARVTRNQIKEITVEQKKGDAPMLNEAEKKRLLEIARESITSYIKDGKRKGFTEKDPALNESMGAFVTLHEAGELRGCIGNMVGRGPLYQTVADMAIEAATGDPRFPGIEAGDIDKVDIEISVLSPMKKVSSYMEVNIPGHGVLVKKGWSSGVYLPQVATETGWTKEEFLTSLCGHKAGLAPDAWKDPATEIYVFSAEVFGEKGESR